MDPRAVARRAEGTDRSLPDLAPQPQPDLGHPQAIPMVRRGDLGERAAARRQTIRRPRALSGVRQRRAEAQRAGDPALAHDPEKLADFSDKIMRKGKNSMSLCFEIGPP